MVWRLPRATGSGPFALCRNSLTPHVHLQVQIQQQLFEIGEKGGSLSWRACPCQQPWVHGGGNLASEQVNAHRNDAWKPRLVLLMWPFLLQRIIKYGSNFHYVLY